MEQNKNHEYEYAGTTVNGFVMVAVTYILFPMLLGFNTWLLEDISFGLSVVIDIVLVALMILFSCGFFTQQTR